MSGKFQFIANDAYGADKLKDSERDVSQSINQLFKGRSTKSWFWKGPGRSPDCEGKTVHVR